MNRNDGIWIWEHDGIVGHLGYTHVACAPRLPGIGQCIFLERDFEEEVRCLIGEAGVAGHAREETTGVLKSDINEKQNRV